MIEKKMPCYIMNPEVTGRLKIDQESLDYLSKRRWLRGSRGEVYTNEPHQRRSYELGHLILGVKSGVVRHLNGDPLDFRKTNLSLE